MVYIIGMITMVVNAWSGSVGESIAKAVFMLTPGEHSSEYNRGGGGKKTKNIIAITSYGTMQGGEF